MSGALDFRPATEADVEPVRALLEEVADALLARGVRQWPSPYPRAVVAHHVGEGELFVALLGGELAGCLALCPEDAEVWPDRAPGEALHVHRLALRPRLQGRGRGGALLGFAAAQAAARGLAWVRLDCWAGNDALIRFYRGQGYLDAGQVQIADYWCQRFERAVRAGA